MSISRAKGLNAHCLLCLLGMEWKVSRLLQWPLMGGFYQPLMAINNDAYMKHWYNDNEGFGGGGQLTRIKHCSSVNLVEHKAKSNPGLRGKESTKAAKSFGRYHDFNAHNYDCRLADVGIQESKLIFKHSKTFWVIFVIKSWAGSPVKKRKLPSVSGTQSMPETSEYFYTLRRLYAREDFIESCSRQSFRTRAFCGLFHDAIQCFCPHRDDSRMTGEWRNEQGVERSAHGLIQALPGIFVFKEQPKPLNTGQDNRYRELPHYKYSLLTPWCRVLLQKLTVLQLVKKFPAFHRTWRFITAFTSVRHLSLSWSSPIQSIYPHHTSGDPS